MENLNFKKFITNINIFTEGLKYQALFRTKKLKSKFKLDRKDVIEIIKLYHHICCNIE